MAETLTPEVVQEGVSDLLEALGAADADETLLVFAVGSVMERIRNKINSDEIPDTLYHMCVRVATGEILQAMFDSGSLDVQGLDFSAPATKIQEGKVDITLASGGGTMTADQKVGALIADLRTMDLDEIYRYRRLVW